MSEIVYARWGQIEEQARLAAESVLTDHDPLEGPLHPSHAEWAQEQAKAIAASLMQRLDGFTAEDVAEAEHALGELMRRRA